MNEQTTYLDRWQSAEKVLCVRLDSLGDVLMSTPAMRAITECRPGRQLALLTSPAGGKAASLLPFLSQTITYEAPWMKATRSTQDSSSDQVMIATLKGQAFDAAIIFTVFSQNPLPAALLTFLADIPLRLAYCRENPYQLLTNWVVEPDTMREARHEVRRQLDLVKEIGCTTADETLTLEVPGEELARILGFLEQMGVDLDAPWLVLHPGASAPSRRYPARQFAEVARLLAAREGFQVILTGGQGEMGLIKEVESMAGVPLFSLAGRLDLPQFAALIKEAPLLLSNNSGPVHIAAAVDTPVVDLYALTNPQHTPWMVPFRLLSYDVPCKFCFKSICPLEHHDCLRKVEPESVVDAVLDLFGETQAAVVRNNAQLSKPIERS